MDDRAHKEVWLTAADCARRVGLSVRALRLYERHGLIRPRRSGKQWRLYGADDIARLNEVLALRNLGLSLSSTAALLQGKATDFGRNACHASGSLARRIARALMQDMAGVAQKQGYCFLRVITFDGNVEANAFYSAIGGELDRTKVYAFGQRGDGQFDRQQCVTPARPPWRMSDRLPQYD